MLKKHRILPFWNSLKNEVVGKVVGITRNEKVRVPANVKIKKKVSLSYAPPSILTCRDMLHIVHPAYKMENFLF